MFHATNSKRVVSGSQLVVKSARSLVRESLRFSFLFAQFFLRRTHVMINLFRKLESSSKKSGIPDLT
ncbi:hypothetical protein FHG68_14385 [Leptospira weilii]|nr:hypothetical protein FHG68_14385 [Leptospira weilii]